MPRRWRARRPSGAPRACLASTAASPRTTCAWGRTTCSPSSSSRSCAYSRADSLILELATVCGTTTQTCGSGLGLSRVASAGRGVCDLCATTLDLKRCSKK
eukprot:scaffold9509_cov47-Phaeocystis_antarctica.AAC.1